MLGRVTLLGTEYVSICQLEIGPVLSPPFFFFLSKRAGNYFSAKAEKWAGGDFFFFFFFFFSPAKNGRQPNSYWTGCTGRGHRFRSFRVSGVVTTSGVDPAG